ncbi:hypothetical protein TOC8171_18120 [Pseudomonas syringae]
MGNPLVTTHVTELHTPGARTLRDAPFEASGFAKEHMNAAISGINKRQTRGRQTTFKRDIIPIIHVAHARSRRKKRSHHAEQTSSAFDRRIAML